jgi:hypothetical protein
MTTLAYAGCFLALAALTGLAATGRASWLARLPLLAVTPLLAIAVWWQLTQESGWPAPSRPADGSVFVASVVQSPTPTSAGAIYLWTQPPGGSKPRAYRLPYSPQLEKQVAQAARTAKACARIAIRANHGRRSNTRAKGQSGMQGPRARFLFYTLPPPGLQAKNQS